MRIWSTNPLVKTFTRIKIERGWVKDTIIDSGDFLINHTNTRSTSAKEHIYLNLTQTSLKKGSELATLFWGDSILVYTIHKYFSHDSLVRGGALVTIKLKEIDPDFSLSYTCLITGGGATNTSFYVRRNAKRHTNHCGVVERVLC